MRARAIRGPSGNFESIRREPWKVVIKDETIAELARLAAIPDAHTESFSTRIRDSLEYVVLGARNATPTAAQYQIAIADAVSELYVSARAFLSKLEKIEEEYRRLPPPSQVDPFLNTMPYNAVWCRLDGALSQHGGMAGLLCSVAIVADLSRKHMRAPSKGRPKHESWRHVLIDELEMCALTDCGHFTVSKESANKGTLVAALELLRPYLPDGVLPNVGAHPLSTYGRLLKAAQLTMKRHRSSVGHPHADRY
jgi:hypothetical protein